MSKKRVTKTQDHNCDDADNDKNVKLAKYFDLKLKNIDKNEIKKELRNAMRNNKEYRSDNIVFCTSPFPHCIINNFIGDDGFIDGLKTELMKMKFKEKSTDLFQFHQTNDLGNNASKKLAAVKSLLFTDLREWLSSVSEIPLTNQIDLFCSKYSYTDFLLCHDDQLEGRVFAFIYYLVSPDWSAEDGGGLALFNTDEHGHPSEVEKTITPSYDCCVFFQVSSKSYHQVSEVLSSNKVRLALSGWFHGTTTEIIPIDLSSKNIIIEPTKAEDEILLEWVNSTYLNAEIVSDINEQFEENSEIQLKDFLIESKFNDIMKELNKSSLWKRKGPVNKRLYHTLSEESFVPEILQSFFKFISSVPFLKLLTKLTGLLLAQLDDEDDNNEGECNSNPSSKLCSPSSCFYELRKWTAGCYTLLNDDEASGKEFALDAFIHFIPDDDDWDDDECGGSVNYLVKENGEELLSISPMSNCLSLVYRDKGTWSFVKYINDRVKTRCLYDFCAVYMEGEQM